MITRVIVGGDVMLGRLVKNEIAAQGVDYPLSGIHALMRGADLCLVNLECAITGHEKQWPGAEKAFYFGAPVQAGESLKNAGVHLVSLANNHILDFDVAGLRETIKILDQKSIHHCGAGENITEARKPAVMELPSLKVGMVAYCDHQSDFAAQQDKPGMAYINLSDFDAAIETFTHDLHIMQQQGVTWPILSLHWGPNMVFEPSEYFVKIAHAVIDMGYAMLFGHSAHIFHGVEIYKGRPIIYSAGDLVDDYYVDHTFKNDHQVLFELHIQDQQLVDMRLHPVFIERCSTRRANDAEYEFIAKRAIELCNKMGTKITQEKDFLRIKC